VAIVILWPEAMNRQPYARLPQARIRTCVRRPAVTRRSNNARRNTRLYDNEAPSPKLMPVRCETSRQNRSRYIRHLACCMQSNFRDATKNQSELFPSSRFPRDWVSYLCCFIVVLLLFARSPRRRFRATCLIKKPHEYAENWDN